MNIGFVYNCEAIEKPHEDTIDLVLYLKGPDNSDRTITIYDFQSMFYMRKPPFVSIDSIIEIINEYLVTKSTDVKLKDGNWINPLKPVTEYIEIIGSYKTVLKLLAKLKEHIIYMSIKSNNEWTLNDEIDYNYTENPFRFTKYLTKNRLQYILSTRYNVPLCGCIQYSDTDITDEVIDNKAGKNIVRNIKPYTTDHTQFVRILSYDIETYTIDNMNPHVPNHEIMCIGIAIFNLSSNKPVRQYCIITKELTGTNPENGIVTEYIVCNNEQELLKKFIEIVAKENPLILTGFNNYGFDDEFVYVRMQRYGLSERYCELFGSKDELTTINMKIDGIKQSANRTVTGKHIFTVDVYKYMLKSNPKLYTQQSKGTLNSMLEVNKITNPWNESEPLSKYDLDYKTMFEYWDRNENIYTIAYYCTMDAVCAGVLLIKMGLIQDKIHLGELSCSSFYDALYKEVSEKVQTKITQFAIANDIALTDDNFGISRMSKEYLDGFELI